MISRHRMIGRARINRRRFLATSIAALAVPCAADAQQPGKVKHIAILVAAFPIRETAETLDRNFKAFFDELRRLGYHEGQNLTVERRSAEGNAKRFPELAREIVKLKPDAIYAISNPAAAALKDVTGTIPIVRCFTIPSPPGSRPAWRGRAVTLLASPTNRAWKSWGREFLC